MQQCPKAVYNTLGKGLLPRRPAGLGGMAPGLLSTVQKVARAGRLTIYYNMLQQIDADLSPILGLGHQALHMSIGATAVVPELTAPAPRGTDCLARFLVDSTWWGCAQPACESCRPWWGVPRLCFGGRCKWTQRRFDGLRMSVSQFLKSYSPVRLVQTGRPSW